MRAIGLTEYAKTCLGDDDIDMILSELPCEATESEFTNGMDDKFLVLLGTDTQERDAIHPDFLILEQ